MSGNRELGRGLRRREKNATPEGEGMREGYSLREPGDGNTRFTSRSSVGPCFST